MPPKQPTTKRKLYWWEALVLAVIALGCSCMWKSVMGWVGFIKSCCA